MTDIQVQNIELAHIAAISTNHCIGVGNDLPWHISADLKHFKRLTQGGIMVLGRKTYDSFGARPLPKRSHWVLTRQTDWNSDFDNTPDTQVHAAHSLEAAIKGATKDAKQKGLDTVWIIGGAQLFADTMSLVTRLELTHVHTHVVGDAYYPDIAQNFQVSKQPTEHDEKSGLDFTFASYTRGVAV